MTDNHYPAELCLTDVEREAGTNAAVFSPFGSYSSDWRTTVQEEQRVLTPEPEAKKRVIAHNSLK